jgi:hypothetical protein
MTCASLPAEASESGLFSALMMHPTNGSFKDISAGIGSDGFTGRFTLFARESNALDHEDMHIFPVSERPGETAAIALHKDGDTIIWSLAPSLSKLSLDPMDVIKNIQVLLRYRF